MNEGKYWDDGITLVKGCSPVSLGCDHCWSTAMSKRTGRPFPSTPVFDEKQLARFGKGAPRIISIWNDLFHEGITDEQIAQTFVQMNLYSKNIYLVLTKRAWRLERFSSFMGRRHIWIGVTAETQERWTERIPQLLAANPLHPWGMCEPLLSDINCPRNIEKLHWVVAGAETGSGHRDCKPAWLTAILWDADAAAVPFWGKAGFTNLDRHYPPAMLGYLGRTA